jgi:HSP20 family protein
VPLPRADLLQDLLSLQERMNRLFETSLAPGRFQDGGLLRPGFQPPADVYETATAFVIEIELPGVEQDDVSMDAHTNEITVRGERRLRGGARPECFHRMERTYGSFSRSFKFGAAIDPDAVTARFTDGLLRIEAPRLRR